MPTTDPHWRQLATDTKNVCLWQMDAIRKDAPLSVAAAQRCRPDSGIQCQPCIDRFKKERALEGKDA